jgi:hypothetical protein
MRWLCQGMRPSMRSDACGWQGSSCSPIGGPEAWPLPERGLALPEARWQDKDGVCLMLLQTVRKHQCSGMFQSCLGELAPALQHCGRVACTRDRRSTPRIAAKETLWGRVRAASLTKAPLIEPQSSAHSLELLACADASLIQSAAALFTLRCRVVLTHVRACDI